MSKIAEYIDDAERGEEERRQEGGSPLSMERATEIFDALHFANLDLEAKKNNLKDRFKRWIADVADYPLLDVSVDTKFRNDDEPLHIRRLFLKAITLISESMPVNPESHDADEFQECWAGILANLAEILARAGLATVNDSANFREGEFVEGGLYNLRIGKKNILATCAGCTENGEYFEMDGHPFPDGVPFFEFDGTKIGDTFSRIGREHIRQDHDRDVIQQLCGYDKNGRKVMKKIREELLPMYREGAQVPAEDYRI